MSTFVDEFEANEICIYINHHYFSRMPHRKHDASEEERAIIVVIICITLLLLYFATPNVDCSLSLEETAFSASVSDGSLTVVNVCVCIRQAVLTLWSLAGGASKANQCRLGALMMSPRLNC